LRLLSDKPDTTIVELAAACGLSQRAVEKNLKKLKDGGRLCRVGADRGGHWKVIVP